MILVRDGQDALGTHLGAAVWTDFVETLRSEENTWMYDGSPEIFQIPGGIHLDLAGWALHTGRDGSSRAEQGTDSCHPDALSGTP